MSARLLLFARVAGHRVEILEYPPNPYNNTGLSTYASIKGAGWSKASGITEYGGFEARLAYVKREVRESHPRAKFSVSYCAECRTGTAPGLRCRHEAELNGPFIPRAEVRRCHADYCVVIGSTHCVTSESYTVANGIAYALNNGATGASECEDTARAILARLKGEGGAE